MIKDESLEQQRSRWTMLYKISFLLAGSNFMVCDLLTLPLIDIETAIPLYNLLLRVSCLFFILTEIQQYVLMPLPSKYVHCFFVIVSVIGYVCFIECSYQQLDFNSGVMYMIGSFLVCGSVKLKLLWIITRKGTNIRRSMEQNRYGFKKHILVSASFFIFLVGTVISAFNLDDDLTILLISVFNVLSGLLMMAAVYDLFKNGKSAKLEESNSHSGYTSFEHQAPEILTVGD